MSLVSLDTSMRSPLFSFDDPPLSGAKIKVMGVGGGGGNAVSRMINAGVQGVNFSAANTDTQALKKNRSPHKIQLGGALTRGLGAGGNPAVGFQAALNSTELLVETLEGIDMLFLTVGEGGGSGTGASPVIATLAAELGVLTVAVVTKPFSFEGRRRMAQAEEGIARLSECVDTIIIIENDRLLLNGNRKLTFEDAFRLADDVLRSGVEGISNLITVPGLINLDFADVKAVMRGMGKALMGKGIVSGPAGEGRAQAATELAISSPLLAETSINGARGVLINITGGDDLTLHEVNDAALLVQSAASEDAQIIFGATVNPEVKGEIQVTVVATGFVAEAEAVNSSQSNEQSFAETGEAMLRGAEGHLISRVSAAAAVSSRDASAELERSMRKHSAVRESSIRSDDLSVPTFIRRQSN